MSTEQTSLSSKAIYGGFWVRLGALVIDFLAVMPVAGLIFYLSSLNKWCTTLF